jgi:hypothetical protein
MSRAQSELEPNSLAGQTPSKFGLNDSMNFHSDTKVEDQKFEGYAVKIEVVSVSSH